jgi:hypothetical protein
MSALTRRLGPAFGVVIICMLAWTASAMALSYDGTVSVEYSGTTDQSFVYQPTNPAVWQGTLHLVFDEKTTVALYGREQGTPTTKVLSESHTISGTWTNTLAPPNQAMTCTASLSAQPGAPTQFDVYYGNSDPPAVGITAQLPVNAFQIQSSAGETGQCGLMNNTANGPGFVAPDDVIEAEVPASPAQVTVPLPSNDFTKTYSASGSNSQVTETFNATLQVTTSGGPTTAPSPPKRTAAQIQAKRNALAALAESTPASLYPCFSAAVGSTLFAAGLVGRVAGGTMVAIASPLCAAYNEMIRTEVQTINDPPRSDYGALVRASSRRRAVAPTVSCARVPAAAKAACSQSRAAAQILLVRTRAAAKLADAIEVTISRESGAQQAHNQQASARQDDELTKLNKSFAHARQLERAAGLSMAKILRADRVAIHMTAGEVQAAGTRAVAGLQREKLTAADIALVRRALGGHSINILSTLGR